MELLPVFAKNEAGVTERAIGAIFLVNTIVIVLAQLTIAHLLEGRRRTPGLALMTVLGSAAWLIVFVCGATLESLAAPTGFALAGVVFGLGECFQGPTQGALVAELGRRGCAGAIWRFRPCPGRSGSSSGRPSAASCSPQSFG
jgi:MFS family permease